MAEAYFALNPAGWDDAVIDYRTAAGAKLYRAAVKPISDKNYGCEPEALKVFLQDVEARVTEAGWETAINIPIDEEDEDETVSLITNYGEITLEQVRAHAQTYIAGHTRHAQTSHQMYQCLRNSLTQEGKIRILAYKDDYVVDGYFSGPCLLKVIIRQSHIDTNATVRHIRENLSSLNVMLPKMGYDITKFNTYVQNLIDSLQARGHVTYDLTANLFKAYKSALDNTFTAYIQKKEDDFDDGEDIEAETLMRLAENKYKVLVEQDSWNAPSKEEEKIVALEAKLARFVRKAASDPDEGDEKRSKSTSRKARKPKPDWMSKEPPEDKKSEVKVVEGKDYHWCPKHKSWTRHKPSDCRGAGIGIGTGPARAKPGTTSDTVTSEPRLRVAEAVQAILDGDSEGSDQE